MRILQNPALLTFEVEVDGKVWGYLDELSVSAMPKGLEGWARSVIVKLCQALHAGEDIWSEKWTDNRYSFLMSCGP